MSNAAEAAVTLPARFRGAILTPGDPGYDDARQVFNRRLIGRPAMIAQCAGVADIRAALRLAGESGLEIAVAFEEDEPARRQRQPARQRRGDADSVQYLSTKQSRLGPALGLDPPRLAATGR